MTQREKEQRINSIAAIVLEGGAPFGPPVNGTIGEVIAAYQRVVTLLRAEVEAAKRS